MAEFPELGQPCTKCNTLDFLPFVCVYCKDIFCKKHREVTAHSCEKYVEEDIIIIEKPSPAKAEKCAFCQAKVKNRLELTKCDKCDMLHCLSHRHAESHECAKLKEEQLQRLAALKKPHLLQKLVQAPTGLKGAKNTALAKKVAYMKLKQKAQGMGSIPQTERLYFMVTFKDEANTTEKPFYFSKEWSFGRCVDFVATELKLSNRNNVKDAPKLKLLRETGNNVFDLSLSLKDAVSHDALEDGDNLTLLCTEL